MDEERRFEEEILASYEQDEWYSVPQVKQETNRYISYAKASQHKDKHVSIRISSSDLEK